MIQSGLVDLAPALGRFACFPPRNVLFCMYVSVVTSMRFVWDGNKNRQNLAKHKLSFETAALVFEDPHAISRFDRIIDGEERWQSLGVAAGVVVLLVAHVDYEERGEEVIRIISARKATPHERKIYEEGF
jgi:uncharacterized DUF497 family protein